MHCTWAMMVACIVVSIPIGCIVWTMRSFLVTHTCMDSRSRMTLYGHYHTSSSPCAAGSEGLTWNNWWSRGLTLYSRKSWLGANRAKADPAVQLVLCGSPGQLTGDKRCFSDCWFLWLLIADSWQERWSGCLATAPWSGKPSSRTRGGWSGTSGALFAGSGGGYLLVQLVKQVLVVDI